MKQTLNVGGLSVVGFRGVGVVVWAVCVYHEQMTKADNRKHRKEKRKQWRPRGGAGMVRTPRAGSGGFTMSKGGTKLSGFWATVVGLIAIAVIAGTLVVVVMGFFRG